MVSSGDLQYILVGISAVQQFREKIGISCYVFQSNDHGVRAHIIKVGADADVVDARNFADVIDMIGNIGDRAARRRIFFFPSCGPLGDGIIGIKPGMQVFDRRRAPVLISGVQRRDEFANEVHMDNAAVGGHPLQNVVGNAARVRIDGEGIRVREDHWGTRDSQRVSHGVGADVGKIGEHSETVHFFYNVFAEFR